MLQTAVPGLYLRRQIELFRSGKTREWTAYTRSVGVIEWRADGKYLATAGEDRWVKLWAFDKLLDSRHTPADYSFEIPEYNSTPAGPVTVLSWPLKRSCDQQKKSLPAADNGFATGTSSGTIHIWDMRQPKPAYTTRLSNQIVSLCYRPQRQQIVVTTSANTVQILDMRSLSSGVSAELPPCLVRRSFQTRLNVAVADSSEGLPRLILGFEDGMIQALGLDSLEFIGEPIRAHFAACTTIALDPMNRFIATGGLDSLVLLHDWSALIPLKICKNDKDIGVRDVCFSADGEILSAVMDSATVTSWATDHELPAFGLTAPGAGNLDQVRWHPRKPLAAFTQRRDKAGLFWIFSQQD